MTVYCCVPAVVWVKDAGQTLLVEQERGQCWVLCGVEATIWDLLTLHYEFGRIVGFLSELLKLSGEEATQQLVAAIRNWEQAGIVHTLEGDGRG
jgi:hypothetical protein